MPKVDSNVRFSHYYTLRDQNLAISPKAAEHCLENSNKVHFIGFGSTSNMSIEGFEAKLRIPQWTYYLLAGSDSLLQLRHYTTHGDHTTQSSAPDDGHGIARNMLSSL